MEMKSGKKLGKMKMPAKKKAEEEFDLSMLGEAEGEGAPEEEMGMEAEGAPAEDMLADEPMTEGADLSALSDDELMAEMEKRGLMASLEDKAPSKKPEEEDEEIYA